MRKHYRERLTLVHGMIRPARKFLRFDLNLDGMLKVTAIERATGLETQLTV